MNSTVRHSTKIFIAALSSATAIAAASAAPPLVATQPSGSPDQASQALPAFDMPVGNEPSAGAAAPQRLAANGTRFRDGSYAGGAYDAYYGRVQVKANVQGGRLVSVDVLQFPSDRRTSRAINNQALPMLEREVVRAQSTRVDTVSGATLTSEAYLRSLSSALGKAGS